MNRKFSSLSYSLQKAGMKIATYKPSLFLIALVIMGISIFLVGGGVYDISNSPLTILPTSSGGFLSYLPYRIHEQVLIGSLGVMILYAVGAAGLLLIYYSTRFIRNPHSVSLLSRIGIVLLIIAFVAIEIELYWILNYPSG